MGSFADYQGNNNIPEEKRFPVCITDVPNPQSWRHDENR